MYTSEKKHKTADRKGGSILTVSLTVRYLGFFLTTSLMLVSDFKSSTVALLTLTDTHVAWVSSMEWVGGDKISTKGGVLVTVLSSNKTMKN